jgi:hypothetical protein
MDGKYTGWDGIDRPASETSLSVVGVFSRRNFETADLFEIMKVQRSLARPTPRVMDEDIHVAPQVHYRQQCQCCFTEHHYINHQISTIYFNKEALIQCLGIRVPSHREDSTKDTFILLYGVRLT